MLILDFHENTLNASISTHAHSTWFAMRQLQIEIRVTETENNLHSVVYIGIVALNNCLYAARVLNKKKINKSSEKLSIASICLVNKKQFIIQCRRKIKQLEILI